MATEALQQADAEGYLRGYAQARQDAGYATAQQIAAALFADAMGAAAGRLASRSPKFSAFLMAKAQELALVVTPPSVASSSPTNGATGAPTDGVVQATLVHDDLDTSTLGVCVTLTLASDGSSVPVSVSYDSGSRTISAAYSGLSLATAYVLSIKNLANGMGEKQGAPTLIHFTTTVDPPQPPPEPTPPPTSPDGE